MIAARDRPSPRCESLGDLRSIIVEPDQVEEFISRLSLDVRRQQGLCRRVSIADDEKETKICLDCLSLHQRQSEHLTSSAGISRVNRASNNLGLAFG